MCVLKEVRKRLKSIYLHYICVSYSIQYSGNSCNTPKCRWRAAYNINSIILGVLTQGFLCNPGDFQKKKVWGGSLEGEGHIKPVLFHKRNTGSTGRYQVTWLYWKVNPWIYQIPQTNLWRLPNESILMGLDISPTAILSDQRCRSFSGQRQKDSIFGKQGMGGSQRLTAMRDLSVIPVFNKPLLSVFCCLFILTSGWTLFSGSLFCRKVQRTFRSEAVSMSSRIY